MPSVPPRRGPSPAALWAALLVIYVVWGSTYFGIAIAIETIPPFLMAAARFLVAGALLVGWDVVRHPESRRMPTARELRDSIIVGGLLLAGGNGFVVLGERTVPSGIAAILVGLMPVWFAVLGWLYYRDRLPGIVALAVAIGFGGVALLVWPEGEDANRFEPFGLAVLFMAPILWAHGSLYSARHARLPASPLTASGFQMLAGGLILLVAGTATGEWALVQPDRISLASLAGLAYLVLFGSMLAYTAYAWLLRSAPLSLIGTYAYVNPVVAVALGATFLQEPISGRTIVASAVILASVAIIVSARARLTSPAIAAPAASSTPAAAPTAAAVAGSPGGASRQPAGD